MANKLKLIIYSALALWIIQGAFAFSGTSWKVVIYMQADNDLQGYAFWDLMEMENSTSLIGDDVKVLVQLDTPRPDGHHRMEMQYSPRIMGETVEDFQDFYLEDLGAKVIETLPEVAFESDNQAARLKDFLAWADEKYPSENTMLIIWGHGEGWTSQREAQFGGIALDFSQRSRISIKELAAILSEREFAKDKKLEILVSDACLMQTAEVTYEFKDKVEYVIGSTQIQNFQGLPYTEVLNLLGKDWGNHPDLIESYEVARSIPDIFDEHMQINMPEKYGEMTISTVSLHEFHYQFLKSFNTTLKYIQLYLKKNPLEKLNLRLKLEKMPKFLGSSRDFGTLIGMMEEYFYNKDETTLVYNIKSMLRKTHKKLTRSLVNYHYGPNYLGHHNYGYFSGYFKSFGIWFPHHYDNYVRRVKDFKQSKIFHEKLFSEWPKFVDLLFNELFFSKPINF
jgi:hypothetical protein